MKAIKTEVQETNSAEFSVPFDQIKALVDPAERTGPPDGWRESWWANVAYGNDDKDETPETPLRLTITRHWTRTVELMKGCPECGGTAMHQSGCSRRGEPLP